MSGTCPVVLHKRGVWNTPVFGHRLLHPGLGSLRAGLHHPHFQQGLRRVGRTARRHRHRLGSTGPAAAPQPRAQHPGRKIPAQGQAPSGAVPVATTSRRFAGRRPATTTRTDKVAGHQRCGSGPTHYKWLISNTTTTVLETTEWVDQPAQPSSGNRRLAFSCWNWGVCHPSGNRRNQPCRTTGHSCGTTTKA